MYVVPGTQRMQQLLEKSKGCLMKQRKIPKRATLVPMEGQGADFFYTR
jgi:hypothetical protein